MGRGLDSDSHYSIPSHHVELRLLVYYYSAYLTE